MVGGERIILQIQSAALPYMAALVISALVALLLAYKTYLNFDYQRVRFAKYFILLMLSMAEWAIFYAGEIGIIGVEGKFFCTLLSYPGNAFLATLWFLFAAEYCNIGQDFVRRFEKFFCIVPLLVILALFTNSWHWLYYSGYTVETFGDVSILVLEHGPLFWLFYPYSFSLSLGGVLFFIHSLKNANPVIRSQLGILVGGAVLPILGNLLYVKKIGPFAFLDPTAFSFALAGLIFYWSTRKQKFLNLLPIARENVIETMKDGYIVLDAEGLILDVNPAALELAGNTRKFVLGKNIKEIVGEKMDSISRPGFEREQIPLSPILDSQEISIKKGSQTFFFKLSISPLYFGGRQRGNLIVLHDITESHIYGEALKQANTKINLMSSITRHDILNQINVLSGYTELLSEALPEDVIASPKIRKYLNNLKKGIDITKNQIDFTKDYQDLGVMSPSWQSVNRIAEEAAIAFSNSGIEFTIRDGDMEVYADPLFQKALYNLFDNSRTHGITVSKISVDFYESENKAVIEIRDNGKGVSEELKEAIFEKSVGKNTGLGLFLVRSILYITGMEIKETGNAGKGARFEITIPPGNWRASEPLSTTPPSTTPPCSGHLTDSASPECKNN